MKSNSFFRLASAALLACTTVSFAAETPRAPDHAADATPSGAWTAYALRTQCRARDDASAQGQCEAAVRGILHGYRYGVVYLGEHAKLPEDHMKRIVVCINKLQVARVVEDFVADAGQVMDDALKRTPAEVALLGSVQMHRGCT